MKTTKLGKLALAMGSLMLVGGAMAADSGTGAVVASAQINPECAVGNATALDFSALRGIEADLVDFEAVDYHCHCSTSNLVGGLPSSSN